MTTHEGELTEREYLEGLYPSDYDTERESLDQSEPPLNAEEREYLERRFIEATGLEQPLDPKRHREVTDAWEAAL